MGTADVGLGYQMLKAHAIEAFDLVWEDWCNDMWFVSYGLYLAASDDWLYEHAVIKGDAMVEVVEFMDEWEA